MHMLNLGRMQPIKEQQIVRACGVMVNLDNVTFDVVIGESGTQIGQMGDLTSF